MMNEQALLQKFYSHPDARKIPVGHLTECAHIFMDIWEEVQKEQRKTAKKGGDAE